jgi:transposase-like protein
LEGGVTDDAADLTGASGRDPESGRLLPGHSLGGAPSPYDPSQLELVRKVAQLGATEKEIADIIGVTDRTIRNWKNRHEEFAAVLKVGKQQPDDNVERSFYQRSVGYEVTEQQAIKIKIQEKTGTFREEVVVVDVLKHVPADSFAAFKWLCNRQKEFWRDSSQIDHRSGDGSMSPQAPVYNITEK